jgi:hypothetical protein
LGLFHLSLSSKHNTNLIRSMVFRPGHRLS